MGSLVSLVMSDIVDSTRRWNADEAAMAADLELHDRLVREVVERTGGSVFKHTGDGMIAVFDDPVAAVTAAAAVQQAIGDAVWQHSQGLRVRVAVHTGVVHPRDGDLFGTAVNRVARLLGMCPGGTVLVSGAVATLLAERSPEGLELRRIGSVTLAGFSAPDDVHAVTGHGLADMGEIFLGSAVHETRLPAVDEELVGRVEELASIWDAVGRVRLVTLVGVGGMGKTRLALEVAAGAVDAYSGSVWWIDLAAATSDSAVLPVAMAAVGARETPGRSALDSFTDRFQGLAGLVVIDNCEHVLRPARDIVEALRSAAPDMRIVATSREALGLRGEYLVAVGALPTSDGIELFVERALAVRPDLDVAADATAIERICARLDGIPLAIELAAARCRSLTPTEIDARLDDRFRLLRGGRAGAERHRTLQAAVAWSYSLLDTDERAVFDQLAVFAGGTLVDGIVAVSGYDEFDVLDIVDRLIARSMVVATRTPLGTRYHQLETLRQFGEDRLVEAGTITEVRHRHLAWVHGLTTRIRGSLGTPRGGDAFRRFVMDVDNLRVAVAHAMVQDQHLVAQEIVADVSLFALEAATWEVLDWVRPLQLDHGWTDAALECAAIGAHVDEQRMGSAGVTAPVGGIPPDMLLTNWIAAGFVGFHLCSNGAWHDALELLRVAPPPDELANTYLTGVFMYATTVGFNSGSLTETELDASVKAAYENLDRIARFGDDFLVASMTYFSAHGLLERDPTAAAEIALRSVTAAASIGATYAVERSGAVMLTARAAAVAAGEMPALDVARDIRAGLAGAFEHGHRFITSTYARAAARLLVTSEPTAAALVSFSFRHRRNAPVPIRVLNALRARPDFDEEAVAAAAAALSTEETVQIALDALDRVIAAGITPRSAAASPDR